MRQSLALALILLPALVGCGGSDHERVNPEVMLDQASAHRISNANVEIDAHLQVLGVDRLSQPLRLRVDGPYLSGGSERIPRFDWRLSASALGFPVGGRVLSTGSNVYLSLYGNDYAGGEDRRVGGQPACSGGRGRCRAPTRPAELVRPRAGRRG